MDSDDLDKWIAAVRGKRSHDADSATSEGKLMREVALKHRANPEQSDAPDEHAYQRLLFKLRSQGLLERQPRSATQRRWAIAAGIAVLCLGSLIGIMVERSTSDETPVEIMRGDEQAQKLQVSESAKTADRIEQLLTARGLMVRRVNEGKAVRLQAQIPEQDQALLSSQLAPFGVRVPQHGRLDVILVPIP